MLKQRLDFLFESKIETINPSGFDINFHPGFDVANALPLQQVRASIFSCSCRLMRLTILSMQRINDNLTVAMSNSRDILNEQCDGLLYSRVTHLIHRLNRQLYERLCRVKNDKINHLSATQSITPTTEPAVAVNGRAQIPTNTDKLVVTIPEDLPLGDDERSLLAKGVNFIPTTPVTDQFQVKEGNEKFFRRLLLKAHFHETNENTHVEDHNNEHDDTIDGVTSNNDGTSANHQQDTMTESF